MDTPQDRQKSSNTELLFILLGCAMYESWQLECMD